MIEIIQKKDEEKYEENIDYFHMPNHLWYNGCTRNTVFCFETNGDLSPITFARYLQIVGKYAISHSPEYREAYRPHYRIVEKGIFENEIKPLIEKRETL